MTHPDAVQLIQDKIRVAASEVPVLVDTDPIAHDEMNTGLLAQVLPEIATSLLRKKLGRRDAAILLESVATELRRMEPTDLSEGI